MKIIAYCMRDKRSTNGIRIYNGKPSVVITPKEYKNISNKDDFVPFTKETISLRGENSFFRFIGYKI